MNILIADDHSIVRTGLIFIIKSQISNPNIYEASNVDHLENILRQHDVDLIICDINMPGFDHAEIITTIKTIAPAVRILMFSAYSEDIYGLRYLKAGAHGYLHKESTEEETIKAIRMVIANRTYFSSNLQQHLLADKEETPAHPLSSLSSRELDVAGLVGKGKTLKEISNLLNIHVSSVSTYKRRVFEKLGIDNVADLITIINKGNIRNTGDTV